MEVYLVKWTHKSSKASGYDDVSREDFYRAFTKKIHAEHYIETQTTDHYPFSNLDRFDHEIIEAELILPNPPPPK